MSHARLSPSGSSRWMKCPGSIQLCEKVTAGREEGPSSEFAQEGTAAHNLAEMVLTGMADIRQHIGNRIKADTMSFRVTDTMADFVKVYVDYCQGLPGKKWYEQKVTLEPIHKDLFGTADCIAWDSETRTLEIVDLKYGRGVMVEVANNSQLKIYGAGAVFFLMDTMVDSLLAHCEDITIKTTIVQPRISHPDGPIRSASYNVKTLMLWAYTRLQAAALETYQDGAGLCAGNHCRFCAALPVCPEQANKAAELAKVAFAPDPVLPDPSELTPVDVAKVLQFSKLLSVWAESVAEYAQHKMAAGLLTVPGYKLIQKGTQRKWTDAKEAEAVIFDELGPEAFDMKLKTPAKVEKLLSKEVVAKLCHKPEGKIILAPESHKSPAVNVAPVFDLLD